MGLVLSVVWRFDSVQAEVIGFVNGPPTSTPNAVSLARQAEKAYWEGDLAASIDLYAQAAELEPDNVSILFEYVRVLVYGSYEGQGFVFRAERALEVSEAMVERHSSSSLARAAHALALIENERPDEAAAEALRATELDPDWAEAHAYLSLAFQAQNRWNLAQQEAQIAVDLDPLSVDSRRILALSMANTGECSRGIAQFEEAIRLHPRLDALYFELVPCYTAQENYDAAIQALDRVLANDPRNVRAWTRKCTTYFRQRDDNNAQESCEQAIALDATFPEAYSQLGQVQYLRRNYEGAIESFETCIALMDDQNWPMSDRLEHCYFMHGLAYQLLDNCAEAMPLFENALLVELTDRGREFTYEGMRLCAASDDSITLEDLPTAPVPTSSPPPPIGIY
ncbi:MAG: tetratricopeptide repeat protein [Chloroflexi bacterium]|nr:tetratricopeptide repeat protein [Chloroflexota bacterium]